MKNISKEMEVMEMENRVWQIREDLPGDAVQSAKLVLAAFEKKWSEVERPCPCRYPSSCPSTRCGSGIRRCGSSPAREWRGSP